MRAHSDYHIKFDAHRYSVPNVLVGWVLEARATARTVEILRRGERVASHLRSSGQLDSAGDFFCKKFQFLIQKHTHPSPWDPPPGVVKKTRRFGFRLLSQAIEVSAPIKY